MITALHILATIEPPKSWNDFNGPLILWLLVIALAVLYALEKVKNLKRNPSIDVDVEKLRAELASIHVMAVQVKSDVERIPRHDGELARINAKLDGTHERLERIEDRLTNGDEQISVLRERQSANAAAISVMKGDVHDTKTMVTALSARTPRRNSGEH